MLNVAKNGDFDILVGYVKKNYNNSYGILDISNNKINDITEKPKTKFNISSGIYVIKNTSNLNIIKKNKFFTMPDLISNFLVKKLKVGAFQINKYWMSIENMSNLIKVEKKINKKFKQ